MSKVLFFDTECNSLDTDRGFIQELAWAIYHVESKRLLKSQSYFLKWRIPFSVDPGAFAATGLDFKFTEEHGEKPGQVFEEFICDCQTVDSVAGHNVIDYDKKMLQSNVKRGMFADPAEFMKKFTFDTMYDCPYPDPKQVLKLKYLSYDHGYILNNAHQALADVFASAHVFFSYPFTECFEIARTPLVTLSGFTEFRDDLGRDTFYRLKFRWSKESKRWERRCRAFYIPGTQLELNYDLYCDDKRVMPLPGQIDKHLKALDEIPF